MSPPTKTRISLILTTINALGVLQSGNLVVSLQIEHVFQRRVGFEGAFVPSWKILLSAKSSSLLGAIGICSTLPLGVALLYHQKQGICQCLDERIIPQTLQISTDLDWLYYEKPSNGCTRAWEMFNGHMYCFIGYTGDWQTAKSVCMAIGGYLMEITDLGENTWISSRLTYYRNTGIYGSWWSGATDVDKEGKFTWTHSQLDMRNMFSKWGNSEPNGGNTENCVAVTSLGKWETRSCISVFPYVCESQL